MLRSSTCRSARRLRINEGGNEVAEYLKSKGYNRTKVSVKHEYCGYSDRYIVTVKDASIPLKDIETLVKKFESIDRDEATGEILSGGNTYIHVNYSEKAVEKVLHEYADKVDDILTDCWDNWGDSISVGKGLEIYFPKGYGYEFIRNTGLTSEDIDWEYVVPDGMFEGFTLDRIYHYQYKGKRYTPRDHHRTHLALLLAQLGIKP